MVFIFYLEFMVALTMPLVLIAVFIYEPFIRGEYFFTLFFMGAHLLTGIFEGLDSKFRNPKDSSWKYKPLMNLMSSLVLLSLVPYSWLTLKTERWGTR